MVAVPNWIDGSWDRIILGGRVMPGIVRDFRVKVARALTLTKGKGEDGPTTTDEGYTGATLSLRLEVYTREDIAALGEALLVIAPKRPGDPVSPIDVVHPLTSAMGVSTVRVASAELGMPSPAGILSVPIELVEWFPESKSTNSSNTPKGGPPGSTNDGGPFDEGSVPAPDPANLGGDFP